MLPDDVSIARQLKRAMAPMDETDGVEWGNPVSGTSKGGGGVSTGAGGGGGPNDASPNASGDGVGRIMDEARYSASDKRGFLRSDGGVEEALHAALRGRVPAPAVLMLHAQGEHIDAVCARLAPIVGASGADPAPRGCFAPVAADAHTGGVVVVLGDDRGLMPQDEAMVARVAAEHGAPVFPVSLGPVVLFASHSIVLLNHYLDKLLHACALRTPRDMLVKKKGVANEKVKGGLSYNQPLLGGT